MSEEKIEFSKEDLDQKAKEIMQDQAFVLDSLRVMVYGVHGLMNALEQHYPAAAVDLSAFYRQTDALFNYTGKRYTEFYLPLLEELSEDIKNAKPEERPENVVPLH